jgi:hypothetical protein
LFGFRQEEKFFAVMFPSYVVIARFHSEKVETWMRIGKQDNAFTAIATSDATSDHGARP